MELSPLSTKSIVLAAVLSGLAACVKQPEALPPPQPPSVTVLQLQSMPVVLSDELPGRVAAFRTADIRPQVGGIVLRRHFEQGAEVSAGQKLFELNPAPFQADVDTAAAALQHAEAALSRTRQQAARLKPLVEADAISGQAYDDLVSERDQAAANVAQAKAALARRRLDLAFATVQAPIAGRIGPELVTEGALVGQADTTPMARVQQIHKVYVDVRQPAAMLDTLQAAAGRGASEAVALIGPDGNPYPVTGRVLFSGISVDAGTGDATIRILVDNPERRLLPGMFVRARIKRPAPAASLLVPQQAVLRSSDGRSQVWVLDAKSKASLKAVEVGAVIDHRYLVKSGLKAGDTLVVEGQERLQEGATAAPKNWTAAVAAARPALPAAPAQH